MKTPYEILGIGAPIVDYLIQVSEEFIEKLPGDKGGMEPVTYKTFQKIVTGQEFILITGGCAANTIKGLANLGHRCSLTSAIGNDEAGEFFISTIKKQNITPLYKIVSEPTAQVACLITPDGERTMRSYLGASTKYHGSDLDPKIFEGVKIVHIDGYTILNEDLTESAMQQAKKAGAKISFDLASFEMADRFKDKIIYLITNYIDILFANEEETKTLTKLNSSEGCDMLKDICEIVVILLGKEGCWVGHKNEKYRCPAFPVDPIDTTGAGDLFESGFLHGLLTGKSLPECACYGAKVAQKVVQVLGAEIPPNSWVNVKRELLS